MVKPCTIFSPESVTQLKLPPEDPLYKDTQPAEKAARVMILGGRGAITALSPRIRVWEDQPGNVNTAGKRSLKPPTLRI
jgi:hypothetical protein